MSCVHVCLRVMFFRVAASSCCPQNFHCCCTNGNAWCSWDLTHTHFCQWVETACSSSAHLGTSPVKTSDQSFGSKMHRHGHWGHIPTRSASEGQLRDFVQDCHVLPGSQWRMRAKENHCYYWRLETLALRYTGIPLNWQPLPKTQVFPLDRHSSLSSAVLRWVWESSIR